MTHAHLPKLSLAAVPPCEADSVCTAAHKRAVIEKDLDYAIRCLEQSGEYPDAVADAREMILRDDDTYLLIDALARLYAEAGITSVGLPKSVIGPHTILQTIVKAIEEASAQRLKCEKESSNENEAVPQMTPA